MSESTTVLRAPLDDAHEQLADPIPAPDTGTDEQTLPWLMDTYSANKGHTVLGVVTGKPISLGGSVGRASATSRGVVDIALAALEHQGVSPTGATAAVQGFGKVGRGASRFLVVPDILANAGGVIVACAAKHQLTLRTAATCLAVRRVAEAHLRRGLYL